MRILATISALVLLGGCEVEHMAVPGDTGGGAGNGGFAAGGEPGHGGTGGVGGVAGGGAGQDGTGGAAGNDDHVLPEPRCTPEDLAGSEMPSPAGSAPWGFKGLPLGADPREATVVVGRGSALRLRLDTGEEGTFGWPGPLPLEIAVGSRVRIASRSSWGVLVSDAGSLAVLHFDGLGGPPRAGFPHEYMEMFFATQCYFAPPEWEHDVDDLDCHRQAPPGRLMSVVVGGNPFASTLPTVIGSQRTGSMGGWTIQNHRSIYLPSYSDETCIMDAMSTVLVTAHTPYVQWAPF